MTKHVKGAEALPLNQMRAGDYIDVMNSLPAGSVDLILADQKDKLQS
ncbi:site-specific DNA-methyltransferase, partial [Synechococcus sp. MU1644]|nr:site-specific DNA-methyltransferase [Synechococcus sp. MU1644]